jgi:glycosyltransferase involved in cell wall biosynthesis
VNFQNWNGFTDSRFGYGAMLNGFLSAVPDGVQISEKASVDVLMSVPFASKGWLKGAHRAAFTMWETDTLPPRFVRWMSQYDQIIVPCEHNIAVFGEHHPNVVHVPLGADPEWWQPYDRYENDLFTFTCGGSLWKRKGLDLAIEAFRRLGLNDAQLLVKAAPHAADTPKAVDVPGVRLIRYWMDMDQERDFYNQSDCFIAPSRGEGFGLIPLQNMMLGVPVLMTDTSGQEQFADHAVGVFETRKVQAEVGLWDEADIDDMANQMLWVYQNRDQARAFALNNAEVVRERFSWKNAAEKLVSALPEGKKLVTKEVVAPAVMFKARVRQHCVVEVNTKKQEFFPGVEYDVTENTHDILIESGYLES